MEKRESVWNVQSSMPHFEKLNGSIKTDVLIIGGGMAGVLCAYFLQKAGVDYVLVEGKKICCGVTQNTTAKISAAHGLIYNELLHQAGQERAKRYLEANLKAVQSFGELCRGIDCDYKEVTSYVYSLDNRKKLEDEADALRHLGWDAAILETPKLPMQTMGAVCMEHQAQFHPLKFVAKIAHGLTIYEDTFVKEFKDHTAVTESGNITYRKVIFATHFPIDNKHGLYFLKMYQHRSYVIALENAEDVEGIYIDENRKGMSFRNYKDLLFLGGGSHRTGKKGCCWQELKEAAHQYYPEASIKYAWAAQDCMTLDHIPYIGVYGKHMPDGFVATGFNKWGMTSSMIAAHILTDQILEKENSYGKIFAPSRSIWKLQLAVNGLEAVFNLLTPSKPRCPHLGCALKWNPAERTWDCPCHGSRFDKEGRLLDNPANGDLKKSS